MINVWGNGFSGLQFFDNNCDVRIGMSISKYGVGLSIKNENSTPAIEIGTGDVETRVSLKDELGRNVWTKKVTKKNRGVAKT